MRRHPHRVQASSRNGREVTRGKTNQSVNMLEIKEDTVFTVGEESHSMEKEKTGINPVVFV